MQVDTRITPALLAAAALVAGGTASATAQSVSGDTAAPTVAAPVADTTAVAGAAAMVYRLVDIGGKALPVEVEKEWRCREDVTAGALTLGTDGHWVLETTERKVCGSRTTTDSDTDNGRYTIEGQALRFFDDDGRENTKDWSIGKDIDLDDLHTGALSGDGTLTVRLADETTTLVFRR